jgi:Tetratricopeptide repeat
MTTKQNQEPIVRTEIGSRESGRYDNAATNAQILTYQLLDKIISGMIEQGVQPSAEIDYFDQWLNLYVSGTYTAEHNEESRELSCKFTANTLPQPNMYLMHSLEFAGGMPLDRSVNDALLAKLAELNAREPGEDSNDQAEYVKLITEIWSHLHIFKAVNLYLNEQFDKCDEYLNSEYLDTGSNQLKFLILLIKINLCLIKGNGWEALGYINGLGSDDWEEEEFVNFKSGIYWTIGMYLEEHSQGLINLLHDKEFPESEKFLLLYAMHLSPYLRQDVSKKRHYLKLAEKYAGKNVKNVMLMIENYNALGFWKDALHLLNVLEDEQGEKQLLSYTRARVLMTARKYDDALELLDALLTGDNKDNVDMLTVKGDCLLSCQRDDEGVICLQRVLEIEPDYQEALIIYGIHNYFSLQNYRQALHYLLAAEKKGALHPKVYEILARIYEELGLMKKSRDYKNKAMS